MDNRTVIGGMWLLRILSIVKLAGSVHSSLGRDTSGHAMRGQVQDGLPIDQMGCARTARTTPKRQTSKTRTLLHHPVERRREKFGVLPLALCIY